MVPVMKKTSTTLTTPRVRTKATVKITSGLAKYGVRRVDGGGDGRERPWEAAGQSLQVSVEGGVGLGWRRPRC
jgi:hypothetical protein